MANDMATVREQLFNNITALKDKTNPLDIERSKAIAIVAQSVIKDVRSGSHRLKLVSGKGIGFLDDKGTTRPGLSHPTPGVTIHKLLD
jgi:hypothetical protein